MLRFIQQKFKDFCESMLYKLEPEDVYEQANLPKSERSRRMRMSDWWWKHFCC